MKLLRVEKFKSTSFHGVSISTTVQKLIDLANKFEIPFESHNDGEDKTNFDFEFVTEQGVLFTVYDWKIYTPLTMDGVYEFHIGGLNAKDCQTGKDALIKLL